MPNPNVTSGELWPQPNMAVINNDFRAAQHLPIALNLVHALMRQRDEARAKLSELTGEPFQAGVVTVRERIESLQAELQALRGRDGGAGA